MNDSDIEAYAACDIHERAYPADCPCPWCERDEARALAVSLITGERRISTPDWLYDESRLAFERRAASQKGKPDGE